MDNDHQSPDQQPQQEPTSPVSSEAPTPNPFKDENASAFVMPEIVQPATNTIPANQEPIQSAVPVTTTKKSFKLPKNKLWLIGGILALALAGSASAYYMNSSKSNSTAKAPSISTTAKTSTATKPAAKDSTAATSGATYTLLDSIQPIDDPGIVNDYAGLFDPLCTSQKQGSSVCGMTISSKPTTVSFYKIGTTPLNQDVIVIVGPEDIGSIGKYYLINDSSAHYTLMDNLTGPYRQSINKNGAFKSNVAFSDAEIPTEFLFPISLESTDGKLTFNSLYDKAFPGRLMMNTTDFGPYHGTVNASSIQKISDIKGFVAEKATTKDSDNFKAVTVIVTIKNLFSADYLLADNLVSKYASGKTTPPAIKWTGGDTNTFDYKSITPGCSLGNSYIIVKNVDKSKLTAIGSGPSGQTIYQLPNDSPYLQELFTKDYSSDSVSDPKLKSLTLEQFQTVRSVFVAQNTIGDWVAYMRTDLFPGGGCGKPVIYLYPKNTTKVNVQVGAKITKSSPTYVTNKGWINVTAQPSGQLNYQGKQYDSLFWEGLGFGEYPDLNTGTVVAKDQVVNVIKQQLKAQGLNSKEIGDFLDYWQPRLPKTAYTLLRWATTDQMNQLAPLNVSPGPDTVIRVFLDFHGIDHPISIKAPSFTAPQRTGFTVVEWGGLLHE